jgi:hypothetical protein
MDDAYNQKGGRKLLIDPLEEDGLLRPMTKIDKRRMDKKAITTFLLPPRSVRIQDEEEEADNLNRKK